MGQGRLPAVIVLSHFVLGAPALAGEGAEGEKGSALPPLAEFRLDLRPQIDDVFGDSSRYQQVLDRFADLVAGMRRICDDFARAVQGTLSDASLLSHGAAPEKRPRACSGQVARSYLLARDLGREYLRVGREVARHHDYVLHLDRLGDTVGLTPDYRWRVKKVLRSYEDVLAEYREMKATFHGQLTDEIRFAGCDPDSLLVQGGQKELLDEAQVRVKDLAEPATSRPSLGAVAREAQAGPDRHSGSAARLPGTSEESAEPPRAGIVFYVDNERCRRSHQVFVDGRLAGEVAAGTRAAFRSTAGPHELCLLSVEQAAATQAGSLSRVMAALPLLPVASALPQNGGAARPPAPGPGCGAPGTVRRSYFHEGWTIAMQCE